MQLHHKLVLLLLLSDYLSRLVLDDPSRQHTESEVKEFHDIAVSTEDMEENMASEASQQTPHTQLGKAGEC